MTKTFLRPVNDDVALLVDATSGNETVQLPASFATQRRYAVRRADASANTVTVTVPTGGSIDGVTDGTTSIVARGEVTFTALDANAWLSNLPSTSGASIVDGSVAAADLADGAVTAPKLADGGVTAAKLASDVPAAISTALALPGTYAGKVAAPTGDSATDTAVVQAAHDALPSTGGILRLQQGTYDLTAGVTFTKPVRLIGEGMGGFTTAAPTRIISSSATATPITVAAHGCTFEDLAVVNTNAGTPSAGCGIFFSSGDNANLTRVKVVGFYNDIQFDQGRYQTITDCLVLDAVNYGLYLRNTAGGQGDFGDQSVKGTTFCALTTSRLAAAQIRWESGGGLKLVGCKANGNYNTLGRSHYIALDAAVSDGVATSVLLVSSCSFEGQDGTGQGIRITQSGTGTGAYSKISIMGNEFLEGNAAVRIAGITSNSALIRGVYVGGNIFTGVSHGVQLDKCSGITVGPNRCQGITSRAVSVEATTVYDYTVYPQDVDNGSNIVLLYDNGSQTIDNLRRGSTGTYSREVPSTTSTSTYTDLFKIHLPTYTGSVIRFTMTGQVSSVGAFVYDASKAVLQNGAGSTPTLTAIGTDTTTTNVPTVLWDVSVNQTLTIRTRLVSGSNIFGRATLYVDGIVDQIWKP